MHKLITIISFILVYRSVKGQSNHSFGIGLGSEFRNPLETVPLIADKDFNLDYSYSWKMLSVELRQGYRMFDDFYDQIRCNNYLLPGFTTNKNRLLSFNMSLGPVFSFLITDKSYNSVGYHYYFPQLGFCIKMGLNFSIGQSKNHLLCIETLASNYRYTYDTGSYGEAGGLTGSLLLSYKYKLIKYKNE